jgi:hypothetical protein
MRVLRSFTRNLRVNSITRIWLEGSIARMFPTAVEQPESLIENRVLPPLDAGKSGNSAGCVRQDDPINKLSD